MTRTPRGDPPTPLDKLRAILARDGARRPPGPLFARSPTRPPGSTRRCCGTGRIDVEARAGVDLDGVRPGPLPGSRRCRLARLGRLPSRARQRLVTLADNVARAPLSHPAGPTGCQPEPYGRARHLAGGVLRPGHRPPADRPARRRRGSEHQRGLDRRVAETSADSTDRLDRPRAPRGPGGPLVRSARWSAHGGARRRDDVPELIQQALADPRPLPVENPADALWWRIVGSDEPTPPRNHRPAADVAAGDPPPPPRTHAPKRCPRTRAPAGPRSLNESRESGDREVSGGVQLPSR